MTTDFTIEIEPGEFAQLPDGEQLAANPPLPSRSCC